MLRASALAKRFGREIEAVRDASFSIERGRFIAIVGRSGSGKSTLLAMIGGLMRPSAGEVTIDGRSLWAMSADERAEFLNRRLGFVFQFANLLPTLRAIDNVALPALIGKTLDPQSAYARSHAILDRVGLRDRIESYPGQLSGGEQRRVAIARALINSPDLILADEPTADLDEETEREILDLLIDIHRADGITMAIVTHNRAIARAADVVIRMESGRAAAVESSEIAPMAQEARAPAPPERAAPQRFAPVDPAPEPVRLGQGFERIAGRFLMWAMPILLLTYGINWGVARYQQFRIVQRAQARAQLEEFAMAGLRTDIKEVSFGTGDSYVLTLLLSNTIGGRPIYVMAPTVRAYVQIGTSWNEVPLHPLEENPERVLRITGSHSYRYVFEPEVKNFEQVLPYYMHVRFSLEMLVSPRSQPRDDLVDRTDNFYVYLKPHEADDAAILKALKFPGTPPVWIPMPPH
jgi:putative ABC transport system ATP-binding protein/macrolide transport system ATP-binding/permease protein/lipoprotein-releasing system ATP-binding protein